MIFYVAHIESAFITLHFFPHRYLTLLLGSSEFLVLSSCNRFGSLEKIKGESKYSLGFIPTLDIF